VDGTSRFRDYVTMNDSLNVQMFADFDANVNVDGNTQIDGTLDVDGNTDIDGTLDVEDPTTLQSTLDVDGATDIDNTLDVLLDATFRDDVTVQDSLKVNGSADIDQNLNVDGFATITGTLNVDGATDIDNTLDVLLDATFQDDVTVQDSLKVNGSADIDANLTVNGNTDLDGTLDVDGTANFDDFATFNDSVLVGMHVRINTPAYTGALSTVLDDPEFEVRNTAGALIFQVDGHNNQTTVQNLLIQNLMTVNGNFIASGDISGDEINASEGMTAGSNVFANNWPTATEWNAVVRKDYVDYHRMAQTDVPTAFSYDASLITLSTGSHGALYNDAVYYLNGNVVLYQDSTSTSSIAVSPGHVWTSSPNTGDNYTITVKGANFQNLLTSTGGSTNVSAQLWLENNKLDLTSVAHSYQVADDSTITFNVGYSDIKNLTDCTSGIVRPTLALGTATGGFHMTGLHFFFDIVE